MKRYFVTGIGTGVGKTVVSAILTQALGADYWKPIQAGDLESSDTRRVRDLVTDARSRFHVEAWRLARAESPHAAARAEGKEIILESLVPPATTNSLVIEGAGGLLVPINARQLMVDALPLFEAEIVLVSRHYLGSINHTLLTLEALARRSIPVAGLVLNGTPVPATEEAIAARCRAPVVLRLREEQVITREVVARYAAEWNLP